MGAKEKKEQGAAAKAEAKQEDSEEEEEHWGGEEEKKDEGTPKDRTMRRRTLPSAPYVDPLSGEASDVESQAQKKLMLQAQLRRSAEHLNSTQNAPSYLRHFCDTYDCSYFEEMCSCGKEK